MPTSINISKYPDGMLDIIESVCETHKPCEITYPSQVIAQAERFRFYGLIRALRFNEHTLADDASLLEFKLFGLDKKNKNILRISFRESDLNASFYREVARRHNAEG